MIAVLAVVLVCTAAFAVTSVGGAETALAAGEVSVNISTASNRVVPGGTITLNITVSSTLSGVWTSTGFLIIPLTNDGKLNSDQVGYFSLASKTFTFSGGESFESGYNDTTVWVNNAQKKGLSIGMASKANGNDVSTSSSLKVTCVLNVSNTAAAGDIKFGLISNTQAISAKDTVSISSKPYNNRTGGLTANQVTITVGAASSVNTLSALEVGHGGSLTAISAPGGVLPTEIEYTGESQSFGNFRVKATATDAGAKIRVGKGTNAGQIAQSGTLLTSGQVSGDIALDAITTAGGDTKLTIVVVPENGGAYKAYTVKVKSNYVNLSSATATSNTQATGATKNGIEGNYINVPSDATEITFSGRFAGGYGMQSTVKYSGTGCTPASATGTIDGNGNFSVKFSGITNNGTVTIGATAGGGKEFSKTYTIRTYSADAALGNITLSGNGQTISPDAKQTDASRDYYVFMLPTGISKASMNLSNASGATIKVGGANYSASTEYGTGTYTVTVTALAGNVRTYTIVIMSNIASAELTKLEISFDRTSWINVLTEAEYNSATGTYTKDYSTVNVSVNSTVYFRYEATDGANVTYSNSVSVIGDVYGGQLAIGVNEFEFTASSAAGRMVYKMKLGLKEGINTIAGVQIYSGSEALSGFTFNKDTLTYTLNVPYSVDTLRLAITIDGLYGIVRTARDGQMERDASNPKLFTTNRGLTVGSGNTITFFAVADNGTGAEGTRYTLNVTRANPDTNNLLASLKVKIGGVEVEMSPAFNPNVTTYTIIDNSNVNTINIEAVTQSAVAKIRGNGEISLDTAVSGSDNVKVLTVVVTAESGVEKPYTINISKKKIDFDKNFDISSILVMGSDGKSYLNYNSATREYDISVPNAVDGVFINVSTVSTTAKVNLLVGEGMAPGNVTIRQDLSVGANKFTVYAVAADNSNSDRALAYVINITRAEANENAYLSSIIINNVPIYNFDKNVVEYVSNQDSTITAIFMSVQAEEATASVMISANGMVIGQSVGTASGQISLDEPGTTITVTIAVTIDGSTKIYTVRVMRASTLPVLSFLSVGSHEFWNNAEMNGDALDMTNPESYRNVRTYYTAVEYAEDTLTIIAETGAAANVRIHGRGANEGGEGGRGALFNASELFGEGMRVEIQIAIVPVTGAINFYTLVIVRKPAPSSSTSADSIEIEGVDRFNEEFAQHKENNVFGSYVVPYTMKSLPVEVVFPDFGVHVAPAKYEILYNTVPKRTVDGEVNENVQLSFGTNIVSLNIYASDEITKRTISIIVVRDEFAFDSVEIAEIGAFKTDYNALRNSYSYSIGHGINSLSCNFKISEGYRYEIEGNSLHDGMNTVYVNVYADDSGVQGRASTALKTIMINVYREAKNTSTAWMVVGILFLVLWVVVMTILVLFILKANKHGGDGSGQGVMQPVIIQANPDAEVRTIEDEKAIKRSLKEQRKRDREEMKAARAEEKARQKEEQRLAREEAAAAAAAEAEAKKKAAEESAANNKAEKAEGEGSQNNEFIVSTGQGGNSKKVKIRLNISGIDGTDVTGMSVEEPKDGDKK